MAVKTKRGEFDRLLQEAISELPKRFRDAIENLCIVVEDAPDAKLLRQLGCDDADEELLGLYVGVPLTERTFGDAPYEPDQILIFRNAIQDSCHSSDELREQIRITLIHELAHYFGFDEEHLRKLGLD